MNEIDLAQTEVVEPPRSQSEPDHLEFEVPEDGKPRCSSLSTLTRTPSEDFSMTQVLGQGVGNDDVLFENQVINKLLIDSIFYIVKPRSLFCRTLKMKIQCAGLFRKENFR